MKKSLKVMSLTALAVTVSLTFAGCSVVGSWIGKGVEKVSANNVEAQFDVVIRTWEGLTTAANNACQAVGETSTDSDSPVLVESASMAYAATYRNLRQKYNATQADIFKAKYLGPAGYPKEVPDYPETNGKDPDFCYVADQLYSLKY